jgi:predicted RNase H-like HicB family nuclease
MLVDFNSFTCSIMNLIERQAVMNFTVEYEQEDDGRWLAEVIELPGVMVYGEDADDAVAHAQALALRVVADRLENGEAIPTLMFSFSMA